MAGVNFDIGDELIERIAERATNWWLDAQHGAAGDGWLRGADKIADYIDSPCTRIYALDLSARQKPIPRFRVLPVLLSRPLK
jgi:hypothetical protein